MPKPQRDFESPDYIDFVASRIKWMPTLAEDLIHACIGIAGELIELRFATSRENTLEEFGDLEFYSVHYALAWHKFGNDFDLYSCDVPTRTTSGFAECIDDAMLSAGDLLDYSKKLWIYQKPTVDLIADCQGCFLTFRQFMLQAHMHFGVSAATLRATNEGKLRTRYPTGYSDAAAQARADKQLGE